MGLNGSAQGALDVESPERCSLQTFVAELEAAGYTLVDACCQRRMDDQGRASHMVRFVLGRRSREETISDGFRKSYHPLREALRQLCSGALWKCRVYLNPYFHEGEENVSLNAVSINLAARTPLFQPNGKPVLEWEKDEAGKRLGETPQPVKPRCALCIVGRAIDLVR